MKQFFEDNNYSYDRDTKFYKDFNVFRFQLERKK